MSRPPFRNPPYGPREPEPQGGKTPVVVYVLRVLMIIVLLSLAMWLCSGCAAFPQVTKTDIVRAEIQVPIPCKAKAVERPAFALDGADLDAILAHPESPDSIFALARAAIAEVEQREAYEIELRGSVAACQ